MRAAQRRALVPARVGLVGNPSDGYGGAVLAAIAAAWAAEAVATPTPVATIPPADSPAIAMRSGSMPY